MSVHNAPVDTENPACNLAFEERDAAGAVVADHRCADQGHTRMPPHTCSCGFTWGEAVPDADA